MSIAAYLSNDLILTLEKNNIKPSDYKPAYNGESVGLDLYNASTEAIKAGGLIPTGLRICLPNNYGGFLFERGAVTKTPYKLRAGVIDPGYTGEIFVNLVDVMGGSTIWETIPPQSKLPVQLVIMPVVTHQLHFVEKEIYDDICSSLKLSRKENKIGSSDK